MPGKRRGSYHKHGGRRFKSVSGSRIGAQAKKVWMCSNMRCGAPHTQAKQPEKCIACGGFAFDMFHSMGECGRWNHLLRVQERGQITNLRRQVTFPLYAARVLGGQVVQHKVGDYIADFVYDQEDARVIEDFKSAGVMDPLADWKLRHMAAAGMPVKIVTD